MLVSLVPATALTASAASLSTSEAALTVLKNMTTFKNKCYQVAHTNEFRIGYGTACNETGHKVDKFGNLVAEVKDDKGNVTTVGHKTHEINQQKADELLRKAIKELDKKLNSFASNNKLTLSQHQHDALALFSYSSGTAWMDGNGVVKTAIINKAGTNDLLNAMNEWTHYAAPERRKIEVNMYVNGVYSNVVPTNYATVKYHPNGGYMAQSVNTDGVYEMQFDSNTTVNHVPTASQAGKVFLGWYLSPSGNGASASDLMWMPSLNHLCAGHTLYALWQTTGAAAGNEAGVVVNYSLSKSQLASKTIYNWPDVKASGCKEVGTVKNDSVHVQRDYIGTDGTRWAKIGNYQWVIVKAGSNGVSSGNNVYIDVTVTVTNSFVNSRVNATIHSATNGSYSQGTQLRIINTANADGFLWGQVAKSADDDTPIGWVALMYTNWNSVKDGGGDASTNTKAIARAVITFNGYVNLRSGAGTENAIVGALAHNDSVDIYEIKTAGGAKWGRTNGGWFCMTYANVTVLDSKVETQLITNKGSLAYSFTGTLKDTVAAYADTDTKTDKVGTDKNGKVNADGTVASGTPVTLVSLYLDGTDVWGKIGWRVDADKDGANDTTKYGWIKLCAETAEVHLAEGGSPLNLNPAMFKLAGGTLSVRKTPNGEVSSTLQVSAGGEIKVTKIKMIGENMWGYFSNGFAGEAIENGKVVKLEDYGGWIILSSKNVQRTDAPTIEADKNLISGKVATVINTDSVKVRSYGATYGNITGSLSRGTTVAVWDENEDGWFKVDSNKNGTYEEETDGWVFGGYLDVHDGSTDDGNGGDSSDNTSGTAASTKTTGVGIVANTYAGVNIRQGAGVGYNQVGKYLPGTQVDILEITNAGNTKWGRTDKGWVCMDYITMLSTTTTTTSGIPAGGQAVSSYDDIQSTPAVYTGRIKSGIGYDVNVRKTTDLGALDSNDPAAQNVVRTLKEGDPVTIYELLAVTENVVKDEVSETKPDGMAGGTSSTTTVTSYWARVNGGYIYNPAAHLTLDTLDDVSYTLTNSDTLNVRSEANTSSAILAELKKGDKVRVTDLTIDHDKVWGKCYTEGGVQGYVRLDYMTQGAYYVPEVTTNTTGTVPNTPAVGNTGNTGNGGFTTSGYKYTGKVINTNSVNVRNTPSQNGALSTTLKSGASLVIYETTIAENMAWGRCDAGWVYLYYVDLTPANGDAVDARVVYNDNTIIYTDVDGSSTAGTYARMSVIDIYEIVGKMARTDLGWVNTDNLL